MDASRCLSYLTIEHRGEVAPEWHAAFDEWVFGCDVCQDVCPWNRKHAVAGGEPRLQPRAGQVALDLAEVAALDDVALRRRFIDAALERARPEGLRRNARLVLANAHRPAAGGRA
jgi:epoxyqueuosine reductase